MQVAVSAFLVVLLAAKSCSDTPVRFEVPQPEGVRDEKSIPKKYQGEFREVTNGKSAAISTLVITSQLVTESNESFDTLLLSSVKEKERKEIDSVRATLKEPWKPNVVEDKKGTVVTVQFSGDTVLLRVLDRPDTIFDMEGNHIRQQARELFVNTPDSIYWRLRRLTLRKDTLFMRRTGELDAISLSKMMGRADTLYLFRPTKPQWKKFIKESGFRHVTKYVRVRR